MRIIGDPYNKDYNVLGCILGSPSFGMGTYDLNASKWFLQHSAVPACGVEELKYQLQADHNPIQLFLS